MILILILLILIIFLLYKLSIRNGNYWEKKNIPNEKPLPLIGNIAHVLSGKESIGMAVKRLYDNFNENVPYFGFYIFQTPYLVLKSPEMINQVMITDFNAFPNRPFYLNKKLDPYLANMLTILKVDAWRETRRKLTPIFTSGKLKMMYPLIKEVVDELDTHIQGFEGKDIEVNRLFKRYTVDTISTCAFGINSNGIKNENSEITSMVIKLIDMKKFKRLLAAFSYVYCPMIADIFRLSFFDMDAAQYLINLFKTVSEDRKKMNIKRNDWIDYSNDESKFDDLKTIGQVITFFFQGTEQGSLIITFLMYELALNPNIQQKLRTEILGNLDTEGCLSYETLNRMEYLDMILKEVLRKYPLSQLLYRCAEQDYVFPSTGLTIEKGTQILIPTLALHLDPNHFPDPDKFDPERFRDMKQENGTYLPFGTGPRRCIGSRFAMMQMKFAVAMFFEKYEVAPSERTEMPLKLNMLGLFMMPKCGLYLKVKKAAPASQFSNNVK